MPYDNKSISRLVLASSSPRRKELVATLDLSLPVSVFSLDTDETIQADWSASETVEQLSLAKATAVRQAILAGEASEISFDENSLILAADTIVLLDNDILGKPSSIEDAVTTLLRMQGREHQVLTGVTLLHAGTGEMLVQHRVTHVKIDLSLRKQFVPMLPLEKVRIKRVLMEFKGKVLSSLIPLPDAILTS